MNVFLLMFLLLDVFFMGVLATEGIRHAYVHFRPPKPESENHPSGVPKNIQLPPEVKDRLMQTAQAHFQAALDHSAAHLQRELIATTERINKLLEHMGTEIVGDELEHYRTELVQLRKQAETDISTIRTQISGHQDELRAQLAEEIKAEKQRLIDQLDTKLADAVGSFLVETMQHNVDLGAQTAYLTAMLEEHKADFIKGVADET